ncbi:WASH complex subunit 2-like [Penaeus monodon]|uniref:WASH complex subunit 2-like n=1 Tax=Penaeus monodon TaxID=6687 RepID=UPI0018A6EC21|nr:WASH complex subunit 2-like [Penaeus monodon]
MSEVIEPMKKASGSVSFQQNKLDSKSSSHIDDNVSNTLEGTGQSHGTEKKPVSLFGSPEEEDIFSIGRSNAKSDPLENRPSNSLKPNIFGSMSDDEDIFSSCSRPAKQKEINVIPTMLSDREQSEVRTSSEHIKENQATVDKKNQVSSLKDSAQPTLSTTKGGVALFGNDELRAKVNERKSMLNSEPENAKITIEKAPKEEVKKEESDLISNQILFDGESDGDIFGISQVTTKQTCSHIPGRGSPPPLPSEISNVSSTSLPEKVSSFVVVPKQSNSPDKKEIKDSLFVVQNEEERQVEKLATEKEGGMRADPSAEGDSKESNRKEESSEEIKPKKPPVGGVSMFGGRGLGGSELFAKVNQRKSMLGGSESDSDGESTIGAANTLTHSIEIEQEEKKVPEMSPASKTFINTTATRSTLQSIGVKGPEVKSGGQENSISFDEPVTTNTLDSLNKNRVRGSVKRRPPSRAHRKGAAVDSSQNNTWTIPSVAQTPSDRVPVPQKTNTRKSSEKDAAIKSSSHSDPPVEDQIFSSSENEDGMFRGNKAKNVNKIEGSVQQIHQTSGAENRITSMLSQRVEMQDEAEEDLFSRLRSASCTTKTQNLVKPSNKSQPSSLFGEDDSDEDLFGPSNSNLSSHKAAKSIVQQEVSKKEVKPVVSHSLFGDDDDDIFSSTGTVGKAEASVVKKMSTSKSKTSLTSTSEPFDDPLLGPQK